MRTLSRHRTRAEFDPKPTSAPGSRATPYQSKHGKPYSLRPWSLLKSNFLGIQILTVLGAIMIKMSFALTAFILTVVGMAAAPTAKAAPCMIVTLTGTQAGPPVFKGLAGAGTLIRHWRPQQMTAAL